MRSFIFNFSKRISRTYFGRMWFLAVVLCLGFLVGLEIHLRRIGHLPSVKDGPQLWAQKRHLLESKNTGNMAVILGASRALLGFDPKVFQIETGMQPVHLSVDGSNFIPVLKDIAKSSHFSGLLICSFNASLTSWGKEQEKQQIWVDKYHSTNNLGWIEKDVNRSMGTYIQEHLVITNQPLSKLLRMKLSPSPSYLFTYSNRYKPAYYHSRMTRKQLLEHRNKRIEKVKKGFEGNPRPILSDWKERMLIIGRWVKQIEKRGGKVVFVRYPTTGPHWYYDEKRYPKHLFWDSIHKLTGITTIHFRDVPSLAGFDCPDTSHLNYDDASKFTKALAQELLRREIIENCHSSKK